MLYLITFNIHISKECLYPKYKHSVLTAMFTQPETCYPYVTIPVTTGHGHLTSLIKDIQYCTNLQLQRPANGLP